MIELNNQHPIQIMNLNNKAIQAIKIVDGEEFHYCNYRKKNIYMSITLSQIPPETYPEIFSITLYTIFDDRHYKTDKNSSNDSKNINRLNTDK